MHRSVWNPVTLQIEKLTGTFYHLVDVELRETELPVATVHSFEVLVDPVHNRSFWILRVNICLSTLKTLYSIMQSSICWIQLEVSNGLDSRSLPASIIFIIVAVKHMIREYPTKGILMIISRLFLQSSCLFNLQILGVECLIL